MKLNITQKGIELMLRCIDLADDGEVLTLTGLTVGNGVYTGEVGESMQNPLLQLDINEYERKDTSVELTSAFNNNSVADRFKVTEMGVLAKNPEDEDTPILFAYGYVPENEAAVIPSVTDYIFETSFTVSVYVGSLDNIEVALEEKLAGVSKEDFEAHTKDNDNPHKVTAQQVGLGNVENKAFTDQTPLYAVSEDLRDASPGEKVGTLFGKLAKGLHDFIGHIKDFQNPHMVTCKQISAAEAGHTHSTNDINSGVLSIPRGGTGGGSIAEAREKLGLDESSLVALIIKTLKKEGGIMKGPIQITESGTIDLASYGIDIGDVIDIICVGGGGAGGANYQGEKGCDAGFDNYGYGAGGAGCETTKGNTVSMRPTGGGGGGSGYVNKATVVVDKLSIDVVVGKGGKGVKGGDGENGGATSFGSYLTALGGYGGEKAIPVYDSNEGDTASGGLGGNSGGDGRIVVASSSTSWSYGAAGEGGIGYTHDEVFNVRKSDVTIYDNSGNGVIWIWY